MLIYLPIINLLIYFFVIYISITVKMDDNIIQHYSNESTFIINIKKNEETHESKLFYDVMLIEIIEDDSANQQPGSQTT